MTIDTSKWDKVSFGDIAQCLTIATKDPLSEGLDRYVGLEHIEPGNIHIKSWGDVAKGTTFTRVFRKGQVLFGKRRAYQKKAALAEFDGICSGDILVCEAIEGKLIPELLPFVVQSDRFFEHAIKTSAGSLSPRTKFKDLAKFVLKLPPKLGDQKRIADLLWSINDTGAAYAKLICLLRNAEVIIFDGYINNGTTKLEVKRLRDIVDSDADIVAGPFGSNLKVSDYKDKGIPILRLQNLEHNKFIEKDIKYISQNKADELAYHSYIKGDIVMAKLGDPIGKTCIVPDTFPNGIVVADVVRIRVDTKRFNKGFLVYLLNSSYCSRQLKKQTIGTTRPRVNLDQVRNLLLPLPRKEEQDKIFSLVMGLRRQQQMCIGLKQNSENIKRQLIKEIFG